MAVFNQEQALKQYSGLMKLIHVGAYEERSAYHHEAGTWPEDGIEKGVFDLEEQAAQHDLEFIWHKESGSYTLEPMSEETRAARRAAEEYQVRQGECVECGRFSSRLTENGYCEGCVMQAAIDAMEPEERWK